MDLKDLYRDVILDHNKRPRNRGRIEPPAHEARGHNPLCGDQLTVYAALEGGVLKDVRFEGSGCRQDRPGMDINRHQTSTLRTRRILRAALMRFIIRCAGQRHRFESLVQQAFRAALHIDIQSQHEIAAVIRLSQHLTRHNLAATILHQLSLAANAVQMRVVLQFEAAAPDAISRAVVEQIALRMLVATGFNLFDCQRRPAADQV